jgi:SAM-dependent methyltransferase
LTLFQKLSAFIQAYRYPTYFSQKHLDMVPSFLARWGPEARVLNVGGRSQGYAENVITLDLSAFPGTDLCGDAHRLPFADSSFDGVLCIAVLEHLYRPWVAVDEIVRVLKPGGELYVEAPFMQPYHDDPGDYYRYTVPGLEALFDRFDRLDSGIVCGPASAVTWIAYEFWATLFDRQGDLETTRARPASRLYWLARRMGQVLFMPLKYLDRWLDHREHAFVIASGVYFAGRRPGTQESR